jgi:hypothetical protein
LSVSACAPSFLSDPTTPPVVVDIPAAARSACLPAEKADIDFDTNYDGPKIDRKHGYADLPKMVSGGVLIGSSKHPSYFGITIGDARVEVQIEATPVKVGPDVWCARLQQAKVTIDWADAIHLATELDPDSCADRLVRETMVRHAALNRDALPVMKRKIDAAMRREARIPAGSTDFDHALALLRLRLIAVALKSSHEVMDDLAREQGDVEQQSEADLVAATCGQKAVDEVLARRQVNI